MQQPGLNSATTVATVRGYLLGLQARITDALQAVEIARREELTMQNGQVFVVDPTSGLRVGGVLVTNGDQYATNGVVHVIDEALPQP